MISHNAIAQLLTDLTGREATATEGSPVKLEGASPGVVAAYNTDDGQVTALWVSNLEFAASVGGALSMIPVDQARQQVSDGELSTIVWENAREVFNIGASLLNQALIRHVALSDVVCVPPALPPELAAMLENAKVRVDAKIELQGYESSSLSIIQ